LFPFEAASAKRSFVSVNLAAPELELLTPPKRGYGLPLALVIFIVPFFCFEVTYLLNVLSFIIIK